MSHTPPSSVGHGPSSSPFAGTDLTLYSPEARKGTRAQASAATESSVNVVDKKPISKGKAVAVEVVIRGLVYNGIYPQPHKLGTFINELANNDNDFISRYVFVRKIQEGLHAGNDQEMELYHVQYQMKQYHVFINCVPTYNRGVHLRFDCVRDACEAKQILENLGFELCFIDNYDFAIAKSQDTAAIDEFEGQIKLVVVVEPALINPKLRTPTFTYCDIIWLNVAVENAMSRFGTVRTYVHTNTDETKLHFTYRVEFHSAIDATRAVASMAKDAVRDFSDDSIWRWATVEVSNWSGPRSPNSPHRHQPRIDDKGRLVDFRHLPQLNPNANPRHPADAHNRVRRERILDGTDVRTTIMLRNIPNKLDWISLKTILDKVCFGAYDFVYLRIDFKSGNNVGYAFINFSDAYGMIAVLDKVEHRGWLGYRSNKNAEISYATIQGRDALVQKFRNSSVMQETPFCRPRLFMTYQEAINMAQLRDTGAELSFPPPDNWSKLQRSMDSARSVGLFPPSGITNSNGFRPTFSAYDRGTPRDMLHLAHMNNQFGPPPRFAGIPEHKQRDCEQWYLCTYGPGQNGMVRFRDIPMTLVSDFMRAHGSPTTVNIVNPGVIGGPAPGPFGPGHAAMGHFAHQGLTDPFASGRGSSNGF